MNITKTEIEDLIESFEKKFTDKVIEVDYKILEPSKPLRKILNKVNFDKLELSYAYLLKINESLDKKIEKQKSGYEICESMPTIANDAMNNLKKMKQEELTKLIETKKKSKEEEQIDQMITKRIFNLVGELENIPREKLLNLENIKTKELENACGIFIDPKARGEIRGALNIGMFEMTKGKIVKKFKANGVKINDNDKLSKFMTDELLKYEIASIALTIKYCDKTTENTFKRAEKGQGSAVNNDDYKYMLKKTEQLGIITKGIYKGLSGMTPMEELEENAYGGQITMKEVYPNR